ncbi:MAG: aspartate 1-decarboxylase [Ignavibacteria bacterium]|nr:aspartate 1-decarboxylase [Ignavibacteria bacterium]
MKRTLLKSKIHRATVTGAYLDYEGSIAVDPQLCSAADMKEFEKIDIYNVNNGARFSTYIIFGKDGEISLNGAAARMVQIGDLVILASYAEYDEDEVEVHKPKIVLVEGKNKIIEKV